MQHKVIPLLPKPALFHLHLQSVSSAVEYLGALSELVQSLNFCHHPVFNF